CHEFQGLSASSTIGHAAYQLVGATMLELPGPGPRQRAFPGAFGDRAIADVAHGHPVASAIAEVCVPRDQSLQLSDLSRGVSFAASSIDAGDARGRAAFAGGRLSRMDRPAGGK